MSKGLEALKNIKREKPTFFSAIYDGDMWEEDVKTIEKELKTLEILEEQISKQSLNAFVDMCFEKCLIDEEKYGLLKEVLA